MAEKISELTGEAREKRIAELKKKMQEAAKRAKAAHAAGESAAPAAAAAAARPQAPVAQATAEQVAEEAPATTAAPAGNGAAAPKPAAPRSATAPATITAPKPAAKPRPAPAAPAEEMPSVQEMNRREFLTYAWGAALGLLTLEGGVISYFYMYPRFRAGEFGGKFFLDPAEVPAASAAPTANTAGKFWLVSTQEGDPKALYMVCTHLGCLYKWEPSSQRFECPCHGSKFDREGYYIEGPAPRSLDYFEISEENGQIVVDTGARVVGDDATESPARATAA